MSDDPIPAVGNAGYISEEDIRGALQDRVPEDNELLDDLEIDPETIRRSQTFAVDFFNDLPPEAAYTVYSFPWRYHLVVGTVAQILKSTAHRYRRNELAYQTGGGAVNRYARWRDYDRVGAEMWAEYRAFVAAQKRVINQSHGWFSL